MTQASSWLQQLLNWIETLLLIRVNGRSFKQLYFHHFRGSGGWLVFLTAVVAMLFWNWKLLLATGAGVLVMLLVYLMQEWDWLLYWSRLRQFFNGSNRQLALAVASGGIAAFTTYMAVSVWVDSNSSWMAAAAILQGFATLAILVLLVWQIFNTQASRDEVNRDQMLSDLAEADPVKRLLAVRRLTHWGTNHRLHPSMQRIVADCFGLMLSREQESLVREAVLEGLQALDNNHILDKGDRSFQTPITLQQSAVKVHRQ